MQDSLAICTAAIISIGRIVNMTRTATNIAKGVGVGMAVGAAAGLAGSYMMNGKRRSAKKKAKHAAHVMGELIESVGYIFK